ncbi:MAG TPA: bifunctional glutamate N-acetyltransferase/amino-acid acetyltransferase ArgJ [Gemmataceae bacterium]|jgi:glutamate N-acetyltransferase/amino-acid N-acetyltransferase|nr:bifunctional glutamate N-acetyltransferase/amino-acid acetyltransferase ArgJ [Gemmataceae bacterium]
MDVHLARGYRFGAVHCGIRPDRDRRDLALIVSDSPAAAAGVFTQNRVCAAPVIVCRERLPMSDARGVVVCSGNANACTGEQGLADARHMTELAATAVGCKAGQMLVASTGVIGRPLPMDAIADGIPQAAAALTPAVQGLDAVAHAICTTDTRIKVSSRRLETDGGEIRITGFAKGAAMIGPNLATMLAFVLTDAFAEPAELRRVLKEAVDQSFNCISVEGHTSTNDTVLLLANGASGHRAKPAELAAAVTEVCIDLARAIAGDAEGAAHLVTIEVEGLAGDEDARRIAKTIADSALVKTAIYGADPNWGRIVSAAGYAGVPFAERDVSLWLGDMPLYRDGTPLPFDAATASAYLKQNRDVTMRLRIGNGPGRCTFWTCDLTPEYVHLNADYTT